MEDQFYIFDPGTLTSKCPMPTRFDHALKFITKDENFLGLHSQEDITNINQQLDQTLNLMVSNIIQRVITQIIGQTDKGFVTIKGTDDGELHVYAPAIGAIGDDIVEHGAAGSLTATLRRVTEALEELKTTIVLHSDTTVQIAGSSQTEKTAPINITSTGIESIPNVTPAATLHITSIMFTVTGAGTVQFRDETAVLSGAMSFGGDNEPRGMTHNFGQIPLKCAAT
ncbi:unnamed protein product, partial [marine sediment metagenome]